MEVESENLEDAIELAYERGELPQGSYVDDSFEVEREALKPMCYECNGNGYDFETKITCPTCKGNGEV